MYVLKKLDNNQKTTLIDNIGTLIATLDNLMSCKTGNLIIHVTDHYMSPELSVQND